jgi:two-component system, OmpR family, phosphate regulon sensor histidine kinase PhoR
MIFNQELQQNDLSNLFEPLSAQPISNIEQAFKIFIAERENEKNKIATLENYRKEYIGNIAHELKTPIFNIQGYIETLADGALNDKAVSQQYLEKALNNIERMTNIIDDLDTIGQIESGSLTLDLEVFDILELCRECIENVELLAKNKIVTVRMIKNYMRPIYVYADKFKVKIVINNLLSNSIKYGKKDGISEISVIQFGSQVEVSVSDDGIGIDEVHLPRLFERFYRIDKGRSREQGGSGLGLSIVKHILEAMNQKINVTSTVNVGTKFTFGLDYVKNRETYLAKIEKNIKVSETN